MSRRDIEYLNFAVVKGSRWLKGKKKEVDATKLILDEAAYLVRQRSVSELLPAHIYQIDSILHALARHGSWRGEGKLHSDFSAAVAVTEAAIEKALGSMARSGWPGAVLGVLHSEFPAAPLGALRDCGIHTREVEMRRSIFQDFLEHEKGRLWSIFAREPESISEVRYLAEIEDRYSKPLFLSQIKPSHFRNTLSGSTWCAVIDVPRYGGDLRPSGQIFSTRHIRSGQRLRVQFWIGFHREQRIKHAALRVFRYLREVMPKEDWEELKDHLARLLSLAWDL